MKISYLIDDSIIRLTAVNERIVCGLCGHVIALSNNGILLIKSFVTLLDIQEKAITLKCGKCKKFNTIILDNRNAEGKRTCLLVV